MAYFKAKGFVNFMLDDKFELISNIVKEDDILNGLSNNNNDVAQKRLLKDFVKRGLTFAVYNLITGKEFLEQVHNSQITTNNSELLDIFVDGFSSNLGLYSDAFKQGKFLVTEKAFESLCNRHEIFVSYIDR